MQEMEPESDAQEGKHNPPTKIKSNMSTTESGSQHTSCIKDKVSEVAKVQFASGDAYKEKNKSIMPLMQSDVRQGIHHKVVTSEVHICLEIVDVSSSGSCAKTLNLPNGFSITFSPFMVHQVFGIPIGGRSIPNTCEESVRKLIADETGCADKFPSINELMELLTGSLVGDRFKRIFMLFTLGTLLCPTSYDHVSLEYYAAIYKPDEIKLYNWSGAVLDKLVSAIYKFQKSDTRCGTSALGGCVLLLAVIYFEFLDLSDISFPDSVPRIRFWSAHAVKTFEEAD